MNAKKRALGRGLSALLENPDTDITTNDPSGTFVVGTIGSIQLTNISSNPYQPRTEFEEKALNELAESIKNQGIIQPITVRKLGYDKYQLISGERRLKASQIAGLTEIPSYIRIADDLQMLEMSLVENIQREDLNPIDISLSFQRLIEECKFTQKKFSNRVGKNRSTITNYLRLLKLPPEIQIALRDKKIRMGHARAILSIDEPDRQLEICKSIIKDQLSVRDVELIVRHKGKATLKPKKSVSTQTPLPQKFIESRKSLTGKFDAIIKIKRSNNGKGSIVIPFSSDDEFDRIISIINE